MIQLLILVFVHTDSIWKTPFSADISLIQYRLPKGVSCYYYQVIRNFTEKLWVATNLIAN